jgi:hypothetical protein
MVVSSGALINQLFLRNQRPLILKRRSTLDTNRTMNLRMSTTISSGITLLQTRKITLINLLKMWIGSNPIQR